MSIQIMAEKEEKLNRYPQICRTPQDQEEAPEATRHLQRGNGWQIDNPRASTCRRGA
jgi:hypothetical protein